MRRSTRAGHGTTALLILFVTVLIGGCSEHTDPTGTGDTPDVVVELRNFEFSAAEVHISAGETVRWQNTASTYHTVTPDGHSAWSEWQTASSGETFDVTFDTPGTYAYYCNPHQSVGMQGTIVVE